MARKPDDEEPFSALAFKIMTGPYVGKLTYFRVYSAAAAKGDAVLDTTTGKKERIRPPLRIHARIAGGHRRDHDRRHRCRGWSQEHPDRDTLDAATPIQLESMTFPNLVIAIAIEPKTKSDQDKLGNALRRLAEEDPTFTVQSDEDTGQTIIAGMGELHLEVIVEPAAARVQGRGECRPAPGRIQGDDQEGHLQLQAPSQAPDGWLRTCSPRSSSTCEPLPPGSGIASSRTRSR